MFSPTFDPLTKVVVSYHLGKRPAENARALPTDLRGRILNQPQITTDGFNAYVDEEMQSRYTELLKGQAL